LKEAFPMKKSTDLFYGGVKLAFGARPLPTDQEVRKYAAEVQTKLQATTPTK
jgi:hypothetical protein